MSPLLDGREATLIAVVADAWASVLLMGVSPPAGAPSKASARHYSGRSRSDLLLVRLGRRRGWSRSRLPCLGPAPPAACAGRECRADATLVRGAVRRRPSA